MWESYGTEDDVSPEDVELTRMGAKKAATHLNRATVLCTEQGLPECIAAAWSMKSRRLKEMCTTGPSTSESRDNCHRCGLSLKRKRALKMRVEKKENEPKPMRHLQAQCTGCLTLYQCGTLNDSLEDERDEGDVTQECLGLDTSIASTVSTTISNTTSNFPKTPVNRRVSQLQTKKSAKKRRRSALEQMLKEQEKESVADTSLGGFLSLFS